MSYRILSPQRENKSYNSEDLLPGDLYRVENWDDVVYIHLSRNGSDVDAIWISQLGVRTLLK